MGEIGTAIAKLEIVLCGIAQLGEVLSRGSVKTWDSQLYTDVKRNWTLTPPPSNLSGRIVYFDGQWQQQTRYDLAPMPASAPAQPQPVQPAPNSETNLRDLVLETIKLAIFQNGLIQCHQVKAIHPQMTEELIQQLFMAIAQERPNHVFYQPSLTGGNAALVKKQPVANPSLALN
jgi:hypothetical protein